MAIPQISFKSFFIIAGIFLFLGAAFALQIQKLSFLESEKVVFFNLPGEAILVVGNMGERFLIDTGMNKKTAERMMELFPFWNRRLDAIFLSHFDADHLGGGEEILRNFTVNEIFTSGARKDSATTRHFFALVDALKIPVIALDTENDAKIGNFVFDTLSPQISALGKTAEKNFIMLTGRLSFEQNSLLLTGDLEKSGEKEIVFSPQKIESSVLKVGHHGSKTSSSEIFLDAGNFQRAVIVAGEKNQYGFPHSEVTKRFSEYGIPFMQTGKKGEIQIQFEN